MVDKKNSKNGIGAAGVYRVMSELLFKGHNPAVYSFDDGIDILLENGKSIQVKTAYKTVKYKIRNDVYYYQLDSYQKLKQDIKNGNIKLTRRIPNFFIFWAVNDEMCLIVPEKEMTHVKNFSISINPKKTGMGARKIQNPLLIYRDRWDLLD